MMPMMTLLNSRPIVPVISAHSFPSRAISEMAAKMKANDIGSLPVVENQRVIGIITDRDIVIRAVAKGRSPSDSTVRGAMTPKVIYCSEDDDINAAASVMRAEQVRRLLVLDRDKRPVGIVTLGDLATRLLDNELSGDVLERISEPALNG